MMRLSRGIVAVIILASQLLWTPVCGAASRCEEDIYPHDPQAFTQGLIFYQGFFLESTGRYGGHSSVRRVDPQSGRVLLKRALPADVFGEGLALHQGILYQLTWHNELVFKYDPATLLPLGTIKIEGEAWGLASDGHRLVMSDGSSALRFVNPEDFSEEGRVVVRDKDGEVDKLNELEFVQGMLYANIYPTSRVVVIDPETGLVTRDMDLSYLVKTGRKGTKPCIPNGIAYDENRGCLFVTGKYCKSVLKLNVPSSDTF